MLKTFATALVAMTLLAAPVLSMGPQGEAQAATVQTHKGKVVKIKKHRAHARHVQVRHVKVRHHKHVKHVRHIKPAKHVKQVRHHRHLHKSKRT